jgi:hypothetical protein
LTVSDDKRAYVLALGADGRIRWMNSRVFTDSEFANLKLAISAGIYKSLMPIWSTLSW